MPRDGSNIYHTPAGTAAVTNTTIASTPYNGYLADIEQDLNLPRPIVAGGTGANNAAQALLNLGGELGAQVVTNYDSFPFASGSFVSAAGATSAPTANAQRGIAYITDANNITVEARDNTTGFKYVRQKTAGSWGAWVQDAVAAQYVLKAGDTMSGDLKIANAGPDLQLSKTSGTTSNQCNYWGQTNNIPRWLIQLGNEDNESGSNLGSNFTIQRYSDAGAFLGNIMTVKRSDGYFTLYNGMDLRGNLNINAASPAATLFFGNVASKYITYDGGTDKLTVNAGYSIFNAGMDIRGDINVGAGASVGTIHFASGSAALAYNGTDYTLAGGAGGATLHMQGFFEASGYWNRNGSAGVSTTNKFNLYYTSGFTHLWIDTTDFGTINTSSDYRIKKDVIALPGMWDTVKKLRPIKYKHKNFLPSWEKEATEPFVKDDGIERWGFIAHELQETLVPSAANGSKDAQNLIQSPNPLTVIAALTKALQEAMSRIEALEARTG